MSLHKGKPTSAGRRFVVQVKTDGLHKGKPHGPLLDWDAADGLGWPSALAAFGRSDSARVIAALAAGRGANVVVIERASFPRNKVCGEFLSAEGCRVVERLGLLDELVRRGCVWIQEQQMLPRDLDR